MDQTKLPITPQRASSSAPSSESLLPKLTGVIAAALTPFTADLKPDLKRLKTLCERLLAQGCDALGILGTTGEAATQGVSERLAIVDYLAGQGMAGARLLPGTGTGNLADTVLLTKAALAAGADNVLVAPPWFFKNLHDDGLFAFYSELIERVGSDRLRVYLYHIPQNTGVPFSADIIRRLLERYPRTLAGLKDSGGVWANMTMLLEEFPGFGVFPGSEQFLLDGLRLGASGCISASVNVTAPLAARVFRAWQAGDATLAATLQAQLTAARLALQAYPFQSGLKALVAESSGDAAWERLMPPLTPLSPEQRVALFAAWQPHAAAAGS